MNEHPRSMNQLQPIVDLLRTYRYRWLVPTIAMSLAVLAYALLVYQPLWEASMPLQIRDEALGSQTRPGQFASADSMKTAQETILEVARSHSVLHAALAQVGPPHNYNPRKRHLWPTLKDIEEARKHVAIEAPNGAEFGKTEVFYLRVKDRDPNRAVGLTRLICEQADAQLRQLRKQKAHSLALELTNMVELARADLVQSTERLTGIEREVGSDLGELRVLNEISSGEGNLRQTLVLIRSELREAQGRQKATLRLLELLKSAQQDPHQLVATPNQLLESEPTVRQLKDGLVAAQLRRAQLLGQMSLEHPVVQSAILAEAEIRQHLHSELGAAVRAIEADLQVQQDRIESIHSQQEEVTARMDKLASLRAEYNNLVAEVAHRTEVLRKSEQDLAAARSNQAAALVASQLTQLGRPTLGSRPTGAGRKVILAGGTLGGLMLGLGIVLLTVPLAELRQVVGGGAPERSQVEPPSPPPVSGRLSLQQALLRLANFPPSRN